ncbi:MAG: cation diffusion facilitator family transporter [Microthrixaceae bacterium]
MSATDDGSPIAPVSTAHVSLTRFAWLSIAAAIVTMGIKTVAYLITGSVGLLSDALESTVNLVAAVGALVALRVAARPADEDHAYGHAKAEYFAAGAEGGMILFAAVAIIVTSVPRLLHPEALTDVAAGLTVSALAGGVNLAVALVLGRAGRRYRSITLEADGKHLMTDVWTSAGVIVAVGLVALTGWERLDPIIALVVAANIVVSGVVLLRRSVAGLMDTSLPEEQLAAVREVLERRTAPDTQFHGLRTRQAGRRSFMSLHVLVPGAWSVQRAHDLVEEVEADLRARVPDLTIVAHVEPLEDPRSFADEGLDRRAVPPSARPPTPPGAGPRPA